MSGPSLTPEQQRTLEELGVERLKMRLDIYITGPGAGAEVFGIRPSILRHQAEEWMVEQLLADKHRAETQQAETLALARAAGENQAATLHWAKIAGWAAIVAAVLGIVVPMLQWAFAK